MEELETGSFLNAPPPSAWPEPIRLVSWNVNRGLQLEGIVEFLAGWSADLILLQETDVNIRRTRYRNIAREIAQALQMNYVFGREFEELGQGHPGSPAFHGQATLSRLPLSHSRIIRFQQQSTFWRPRWFIPCFQVFQRRLGARLALRSEITIQGRTLVVYNLHLESRGDDPLRRSQLSETLVELHGNCEVSRAIVAGDFNFDVSQGSAATLVDRMLLDNPFLGLGRRRTVQKSRRGRGGAIDWVLTGRGLSASHPEIHRSIAASDHYPLTLQIGLKQDGC